MSSAQHIPPDDLILFALQFLPEAEMSATRRHLLECEACRRQVGWVQGDLASYAMTAGMQAPPDEARERLLSAVAREKKFIPIDRPVAVPRPVHAEPEYASRESRLFTMSEPEPRRSGALGWLGWAVAAGVAVAGGLQFQQRQNLQQQLAGADARIAAAQTESAKAEAAMQALAGNGATQVALHLPASAGSPATVQPYGQAVYIPKTGALVFVASHLDPLAPRKVYELWLLPADKSAPMPAGTFKPDTHGNASVVMPDMPKGVDARGFAVTVEDDGGSPKPTTAAVLSGV